MERVGVRELRQHASRYLRLVKAGETVEVTERGKLVALLVPAQPAVTARDRLLAAGQLIAATGTFRFPARSGPRRGQPDTETVLGELRADRL